MEKVLKLSLVCFLISLSISSCKKKEDSGTNLATLPFAKESVDAGKTKLADAGTELINTTDQMVDSKGMTAIESFVNLNNSSAITKQSIIFQPLNALAAADRSVTSIVKSLNTNAEDPKTLQAAFDSIKGLYAWSGDHWTKTESTTSCEFTFPHATGSANDAKIVVTYTGVHPKNSIDSKYTGDYPSALNVTLTVSAEKVFEYDFTASYSDDGVPTSVKSYVMVPPFKIGVEWAYSASDISIKYYFTNDGKTVIEYGASTAGNFAYSNIQNSESPDNIINSANAYFQVFNIKLAGQVDYKGMLNEAKTTMSDTDNDSVMIAKEASLYNKYALLVLFYADSKQKIAQAEYYPLKVTHYYGPYYSNSYWKTEIRFIFADNSKGNMDDYFKTGFSDLQTSFNNLIKKLNDKYSK